MIYRKFKADYLFTGRDLAGEEAVLVTTEDGTVEAILPAGEAGEDVEHFRGVLSPGFINCQCHLELSHMRGVLPEKTGLVDFLLSVMRQRNAPPPPARGEGAAPDRAGAAPDGAGAAGHSADAGKDGGWGSAMADAEEEMLHNGIVAVGDICNTADSLPLKKAGRLYYHNFIETMGFIGADGAPGRSGTAAVAGLPCFCRSLQASHRSQLHRPPCPLFRFSPPVRADRQFPRQSYPYHP